jgi:ABC-type Fe3+-hydroxamate transport system substrate-binding protein
MRAAFSLVAALAACTSTANTTNDTATAATAAASPATAGCASTPEDARAQIAQLETQWETAFYRRDTAFFARTLDDGFVAAGTPTPGGKKDYIAGVMKGPAVPDSITGGNPPTEDVRALSPDVVVVSGVWTNKAAPTEKAAYTEIFACRNGQWKAVHGHYNDLPAPARR